MADNNTTQTTVFNEMDNYFMGIAILAAKQSEDPKCKVGACIVDKNEVVSVGYNKMPQGITWDMFAEKANGQKRKDKDMPKDEGLIPNDKGLMVSMDSYICHAEFNAMVNGRPANFEGCTMYVTLSPCNECAKLVIRLGIKRVIYLRDLEDWKNSKNASNEMEEKWKKSGAIDGAKAAKNMLREADISCKIMPDASITAQFGQYKRVLYPKEKATSE